MHLIHLVLKEDYPGIIPIIKTENQKKNWPQTMEINQYRDGSKYLVTVCWKERVKYKVIKLLAASLYRYITGELKIKFIREILINNREILTEHEQEQLLQEIKEKPLVDDASFSIKKMLLRYFLEGNRILNLEGFLRFRLAEYYRTLEDAVYLEVGSFLKKQKHYAYVGMLKLQLNLKDPLMEIAHLDADLRGHIYLSTDYPGGAVSWKMISMPYHEDYIDLVEDIICHLVISFAPRYLVLHRQILRQNQEMSSILERVFGERLMRCTGCASCKVISPGIYSPWV